MNYFKIDIFLNIISINTDNNLNKETAAFTLNTNCESECVWTGAVMGHSPQIQDQLLKHFLDAIHLLQLRFIKLRQAWRDSAFLTAVNCIIALTVLQGNPNLLQTGSKNAAFKPVFIIPASALKEWSEH